jgi:purine-binding chemotaxis protein CheW
MTQAAQQIAVAPVATGALAAIGHERNEFLTFSLGQEAYGIEILKVQEIRGYEVATTIPNAPSFLKGVINLRGTIVPIIDLRIKFNFANVEYTAFTVVIILNIANRVVGIVVDGVSDVITLTTDQIKQAPDFSASFDTDYITGIASVDSRTLILVDIEKLIGSPDMALVEKSVQ